MYTSFLDLGAKPGDLFLWKIGGPSFWSGSYILLITRRDEEMVGGKILGFPAGDEPSLIRSIDCGRRARIHKSQISRIVIQ